jgi:hypothetical protein
VPIKNGQDDHTTGCPRCHSLMVVETFVDYESGSDPACFLGRRCVICGAICDPLILLHQSTGWGSVNPRSQHTTKGHPLHPDRRAASPHPVGAGGRTAS